jgi:hypothetical protein
VIKSGDEANVLLEITKSTLRDRPIKEGDMVEAHIAEDGTVRSINHVASRPSTSASWWGRESFRLTPDLVSRTRPGAPEGFLPPGSLRTGF